MPEKCGAIIVISSHVVRGTVGNRAAVFALESMAHPVWALPTVVLPWHPGHGSSTRLLFASDDFAHAVDDLIRAPWLGEVRAVLSGYFGHADQPVAVAKLVDAVKAQNPDVVYACDPVIGDVGGLYVPQATAEAIRSHLLPRADLITPNRYELAWLSRTDADSNAGLIDAAKALGCARTLVTSAVPMMAGAIGNLYVGSDKVLLAEHRLVPNPPNGVGDLLSAVFLSRLLSGAGEEEALRLATASIFEILLRSSAEGSDELLLHAHASSLTSPLSPVQVRRIHHMARASRR